MVPGPDPQSLDDDSGAHMRRVRALVETARELPEHERAGFVAREAEGDRGLRREVLELLDLDRVEALETAAVDGLEGPSVPRVRIDVPRLSRWKLLREIGSGGMGTVYLGVRDDGQFKMRVAVKIIKRGMDTDEVLRRFERERQVLASLDHPGIARLLDGGISVDGRPYLVLEYVEGDPVDRWCDSQRLTVRERIELFCEVCDAVNDAHRSLVVHRDIKPSNVLVDTQGRPRLLDFGIAKVLDPEKGDQTVEVTGTPLRLMTPAYASPEQVRGGTITTASDVYSLGALLFQLLTGRPPFQFDTGSAAELERVVCELDATRCSQAVSEDGDETAAERRGTSPRALARVLGGDIDTVVAKALRKEPRRRYASASELADDLRRHLRGLPVTARPDTFSYRASKFVRRNRLAVASGVAVILALVGGLAISLWQYGEAREASERLADELEIGARRNEALQDLNGELAREREAARASQELAEERADELELLTADLRERTTEAERAREAALEAETDAKAQRALAERRATDIRTFATGMIYDVHRALAPVEGALEARRVLVETGLPFLDRLREEGEDDPRLAREMVGALQRLSEIQGSDTEDTLGDVRAALESLEKALELAVGLQEADPDNVSNDFSLASTLMLYSDTLELAGRASDANEALEGALEVCSQFGGTPASTTGLDSVLFECVLRAAKNAVQRGDLDGARDHLEEALIRLEDLPQRGPSMRSNEAKVYFELARVELAGGNTAAALATHEEGEAVMDGLIEGAPDNARLKRFLDTELLWRGKLLADAGRFQDALDLARRLAESFGAQSEEEPGNAQPLRYAISSLELVARVAGELELWQEAVAAISEARDAARAFVELQPENGFALHDLGRIQLRVGLLARERGLLLDADAELRETCVVFKRFLDRDPRSPLALRSLRNAQSNLAIVTLQLAHRDGLAESERRQWLRRAQGVLAETVETIDRLADVSAPLGEDTRAEEFARSELELCGRKLAELGEER